MKKETIQKKKLNGVFEKPLREFGVSWQKRGFAPCPKNVPIETNAGEAENFDRKKNETSFKIISTP
jgi:hypothetical protein